MNCIALYEYRYGDETDTVDVKAKRSDGVLASDAVLPRILHGRWLKDVRV